MEIKRVWAMPDSNTFQIKPIAQLLAKYVGDGTGWIDPFANTSQMAEFKNDLNPSMPTQSHKDALHFLREFKDESAEGVLLVLHGGVHNDTIMTVERKLYGTRLPEGMLVDKTK